MRPLSNCYIILLVVSLTDLIILLNRYMYVCTYFESVLAMNKDILEYASEVMQTDTLRYEN